MQMHHSGMDHGHGDMDMGGQCNTNMLFTFSTNNLCIVFPQWRITGPFSLLLSLIAVVLLTAGYEAVREWTRRYEASSRSVINDTIAEPPSPDLVNLRLCRLPSPISVPFPKVEAALLDALHVRIYESEDDGVAANDDYNTVVGDDFTATYHCHGNTVSEETGLLFPVARNATHPVGRRRKAVLGVLYAVQVFYSFFIMLLFMTYNGWIMFAVAAGAFVGYMTFNESSASRSVSCH